MLEKINLAECLSQFDEHWSPKIVGELNDSHLKLAKLKGEFVWHHHENEDELFVVLAGELLVKLRDGEIRLRPGECLIIPRGTEHLPIAEHEVHLMLIEPKTTRNTGNITNERTITHPERL